MTDANLERPAEWGKAKLSDLLRDHVAHALVVETTEEVARECVTVVNLAARRLDELEARTSPTPADDVVERVARDSEGKVLICTGCGSTDTVEWLRQSRPGTLSCCPERKMVRAALTAVTPQVDRDAGLREALDEIAEDNMDGAQAAERARAALKSSPAPQADEWETIPARMDKQALGGLNDTYPGDPVRVRKVATSRDVMLAGGVDPDAPFVAGPFPAEMRQAAPQAGMDAALVEWAEDAVRQAFNDGVDWQREGRPGYYADAIQRALQLHLQALSATLPINSMSGDVG